MSDNKKRRISIRRGLPVAMYTVAVVAIATAAVVGGSAARRHGAEFLRQTTALESQAQADRAALRLQSAGRSACQLAAIGGGFAAIDSAAFGAQIAEHIRGAMRHDQIWSQGFLVLDLRGVDSSLRGQAHAYTAVTAQADGGATRVGIAHHPEATAAHLRELGQAREQGKPFVLIDAGGHGDTPTVTLAEPIRHRGAVVGVAGYSARADLLFAANGRGERHPALVDSRGSWVTTPADGAANSHIAAGDDALRAILADDRPAAGIDTATSAAIYALRPVAGSQGNLAAIAAMPTNWLSGAVYSGSTVVALILMLGLAIICMVLHYACHRTAKALEIAGDNLRRIMKGWISAPLTANPVRIDETAELDGGLEQLRGQLAVGIQFVQQIGAGDFDAEFHLDRPDDEFSAALIQTRHNLRKSAEQLARKQEEERLQHWGDEQSGRLTEIIRQTSGQMSEMCPATLGYLIKSVRACQGAIYIQADSEGGDTGYDMQASIAYDRARMLRTRVEAGEGLVGRCAFEKSTLVLTDIPEGYAKITSGLGDRTPTCMALVPMIAGDAVVGVAEIMSMYTFEPHEVAFLEKSAEALAAAISAAQTAQRTQALLEQSREQGETLARQEQEMRQNIEEMAATNEEYHKREAQTRALTDAVERMAMVAEYDMEGRLTDINQPYLDLLGLTRQQALGLRQGTLDGGAGADFEIMWNRLRQGHTTRATRRITANGRQTLLTELFAPVEGPDGRPEKVYSIAVETETGASEKPAEQ